jgi:hypothetical protein
MTTSTQDLQEEFLTALRKGQQTMIGALRIWVETVQTVTPKLTGVYAPLTDRLPRLPNVGVPFAHKLPSPRAAVGNAYGLAEELLANQRKFAEAVLDTAAPLMPRHENGVTRDATPKAAPKPVVIKTDPRPAAPKPAPRKATAPKAAAPKAAALKAAALKAAAPKAATPKPPAAERAPRTTPKRTPKSADAS